MSPHTKENQDMFAQRLQFAGMFVALLLAMIPGSAQALSVPDAFPLNPKGTLYESFQFNHAKHIKLTRECSGCHHHTTGTLVEDPNCIRCHRNSGENKVVQCRGCHHEDPFSAATLREKNSNRNAYHQDKPGLKGAMHRNCIGCHTKVSRGPIGCNDCHKRKKTGDEFYSAGDFAPRGKPGKGEH